MKLLFIGVSYKLKINSIGLLVNHLLLDKYSNIVSKHILAFFFLVSKSSMVYLWMKIVTQQEDVILVAREAASVLLKRAGIIIPNRMNIL